jgi:hypothetical protein
MREKMRKESRRERTSENVSFPFDLVSVSIAGELPAVNFPRYVKSDCL